MGELKGMPSEGLQQNTLQQAVFLVVSTPAVKLLDGHGEHANTGSDEDATLNEVPQDILVAKHANSHHRDNTPPDDHDPNERTEEKNHHPEGSFHDGATRPFCPKQD
jgi:hypothetical protein